MRRLLNTHPSHSSFPGVGEAEGRAVPASAADLRGEAAAARAHHLRVEADRARGGPQPGHLLGVLRGGHLRQGSKSIG